MTDIDKLEKVVELQARLLIRLAPNLSDSDKRDVLMCQEQAQTVLDEKISTPTIKDGRKTLGFGRKQRKNTRQRGKERDREGGY
mgnify:CR=1 FL=1